MNLKYVWNMMKPGTPILTVATLLFIGGVAFPAFAANEPLPGIYQKTKFIAAVSGGTGGECDNWGPANTEATPRIFTYPGPALRGATERLRASAGDSISSSSSPMIRRRLPGA
jgi:hypothetical protein